MDQIQHCLDHESEETDGDSGLVKIYTSGSFLDEREVPAETRQAIASALGDRDRIVVESLPGFVDRETVEDFTEQGLETDVAVGLETATDRVGHDRDRGYRTVRTPNAETATPPSRVESQ